MTFGPAAGESRLRDACPVWWGPGGPTADGRFLLASSGKPSFDDRLTGEARAQLAKEGS